MRSKSILSGVNVPIEPSANVDNQVTNNITIRNYNSSEVKYGDDVTGQLNCQSDDGRFAPGTGALAPCTTTVVPESAVYSDLKTPATTTATMTMTTIDNVSSYLLTLYKRILLNEDKKLLSNLISKNRIILTQQDLEEVVKRKVGKECTIMYEDPEPMCCDIDPVFLKITSIRVYEDDKSQVDFAINYNKEYLELITEHQLCTEFVLVN